MHLMWFIRHFAMMLIRKTLHRIYRSEHCIEQRYRERSAAAARSQSIVADCCFDGPVAREGKKALAANGIYCDKIALSR